MKKQLDEREYYVQICPECGSTNVKEVVLVSGKDVSPSPYSACLDCNYGVKEMVVFPKMNERFVEQFRKYLKTVKKDKENKVTDDKDK